MYVSVALFISCSNICARTITAIKQRRVWLVPFANTMCSKIGGVVMDKCSEFEIGEPSSNYSRGRNNDLCVKMKLANQSIYLGVSVCVCVCVGMYVCV